MRLKLVEGVSRSPCSSIYFAIVKCENLNVTTYPRTRLDWSVLQYVSRNTTPGATVKLKRVENEYSSVGWTVERLFRAVGLCLRSAKTSARSELRDAADTLYGEKMNFGL